MCILLISGVEMARSSEVSAVVGAGVHAGYSGSGESGILTPSEPDHTALTSALIEKAWGVICRAATGSAAEDDPLVRWDIQGHALLEVDGVYCSIDCLRPNKTVRSYTPVEEKIAEYLRIPIQGLERWPYRHGFISSDRRSSIVNLQRELDMHLRLVARAIYKANRKELADIRCQTAVSRCYEALDDEIRNVFRQKLMAYYDERSDSIDIHEINKHLDSIRLDLLNKYERQLLNLLFAGNPALRMPSESDLDMALQSTTALSGDYLQTDQINKQVVRISASEYTAHDKRLGAEHLALRRVHRFDLCATSRDGYGYILMPSAGVEARVPSLAVLKSTVDQEAAIGDVVAKLKYLWSQLGLEPGQVLIYNLLTSLHSSGFFDKIDNHQTKSASIILEAIHRFNKENMTSGQRILLQNIPINLHTDSLSLISSNRVIADATLMAEISLIETLHQHNNLLNDVERVDIEHLHDLSTRAYNNFLDSPKQNESFSASDSGKGLIRELRSWQRSSSMYDRSGVAKMCDRSAAEADTPLKYSSIKRLVSLALHRLYVTGLYAEQKFGTLVQALSVYLQDSSLYGCKSANERFQMVAGRVGMLAAVQSKFNLHPCRLDSSQEKALVTALVDFDNSPLVYHINAADRRSKISAAAERLKSALDALYNYQGLHAALSSVSEIDQGGGPKIELYTGTSLNTNMAEQGVPDLFQAHASPFQAHKSAKRLCAIAKTVRYVDRSDARRRVAAVSQVSMFSPVAEAKGAPAPAARSAVSSVDAVR